MDNYELNFEIESQGTVNLDMGAVEGDTDGAFAGVSEAWAVGKKNGVDVASTAAQYHNNSKYYAEQAAGSATSAGTSAAAAELAKNYAQTFTGAPRAASSSAGMTDHSLIYVYTGTTSGSLTNGHWYYWDVSAWADGGVYNSVAVETDKTLSVSGAAADAAKVGDLKSAISKEFITITPTLTEDSIYINASTLAIGWNGNTKSVYFKCEKNTIYRINKTAGTRFCVGLTTVVPASGGVCTKVAANDTASQIEIISDSTSEYVIAYVWNSSTDTGISSSDMISSIVIEKNNFIDETARESILELNEEIQINDVSVPVTIISSVGGIDYSDGSIEGTNSARHTDYVNISAFANVKYKRMGLTGTNTVLGMAFYNENKVYISGEKVATGQSSTGYVGFKTISVPANAKYARFSTFSNTTTYGSFELYGETKLKVQIEGFLGKGFVTVDASGNGDYLTISDAIRTESENTVIFVKPGVYNEDMGGGNVGALQKRVILIGTDRNTCIIRCADGRRYHHALYVSCGYFENITFEAPYISGTSHDLTKDELGAYAVHIDSDNDYGIGKTVEFHHCNMYSAFSAAIGIGLRKDMHFTLDDCIIVSGQPSSVGPFVDDGSYGALFFHDSNGIQGDQYFTMKDCLLKSENYQNALCIAQTSSDPNNNHTYLTFTNNVSKSTAGYVNNVWLRDNPMNVMTIVVGYGNSASALNAN